ncbi:hypothetical protein TSUD_324770 [Trifolium subterraneum]|uniref:Uncharacterized protein n=1 Tax=Trifolium subterraneum TaxID=3900 RepID=A0A2Z6PDU0_TRISU|nr:hypothetical protein TSUD_324770 [Trifolium subterraneum]
MAAKMMLSSPHPLPLRSLPFHTTKLQPWHHQQQQHLSTPKPKKLRLSLHESAEFITHQQQLLNPNSLLLLTTETSGYSLASYYTSLGLFVISVPGLWFEGVMVPSRGQAALLTFCTAISLASVSLVLTITVPDVGNNWFWLTILSPLAGAYYWTRASRKEQIKVKMIVKEDGTLSEIVVQGDDQQVEQMRKELKFSEKGMVYVKGLFET